MKPIIAIDCETGGLDETKHALLSVGLVELDENFNPVRLKEVFILPTLEVQGEAARINGYSPEEWIRNSAVSIEDAFSSIKKWVLKESIFIAHNSEFDKKFFFKYFSDWPWDCTKKLYQSIAGDPCNLSTAAVKVGHWPEDYSRKVHGALIDALACAAVYKWCKQQQSLLTQDLDKDSPLNKYYEIDKEVEKINDYQKLSEPFLINNYPPDISRYESIKIDRNVIESAFDEHPMIPKVNFKVNKASIETGFDKILDKLK